MASKKKKDDTFERFIPVLVFVSVILAFAVGVLWQKVSNLEGGGTTLTRGTGSTGQQAPDQGQQAGDTARQRLSEGKLSQDQISNIPEVTNDDHIRGSADAQVYLIEYSDFECPFCSRFHPTMQQVMDEYSGQVAWVYRHFPLDQIHPDARPAAEASECVAELGGEEAFWAFADALFADQTRLNDLASVAGEVGVDTSSFQSCVDEGRYADFVENQYQGGVQAGITGTPGNIVVNQNGDAWLIPGALPFEQVKITLDEALSG
ncbi:MAG: DsbA family protein [Candidatus Woesebacteria bacterium]|jgi:protein-disulfide isomerase